MLIRCEIWGPRVLGLATASMVTGLELDVGLKLRPFDMLVALAVLLAVLPQRHIPLRGHALTAISCSMLAYGLYMLGNALLLSRLLDAAKETVQYVAFILFFFALVKSVRSDLATQIFARWVLVGLVLVGLWNAGWHISQGVWAGWKGLDEPKLSHSLLVVFIAILAASAPLATRGFWRACLLIAVAIMFLSGERKGWIAAGAALTVLAVFMPSHSAFNPQRLCLQAIVIAGIITTLLTLAPHIPYLSKQLESSWDYATLVVQNHTLTEDQLAETTLSNRARLFGLTVATGFFRQSPVTGIGLENYDRRVNQMDLPDEYQKGAHNEVLRIAAELGIVGLSLYAALHGVIAARLARLIQARAVLSPLEQFRLRLGLGYFAYGAVANVFLGGGGVNLFLVFLPAALIFSLHLPPNRRMQRPKPGPSPATASHPIQAG